MPEFRDVIPGSQVSVSQPSLAGLQAALAAGTLSSAALTGFYLQRIERLNPALHAVITVNADAPAEAAASDAARAVDGPRGPLEGIPVLVKDNVQVAGMPTTAGSPALLSTEPGDAFLVERLRAAGAVIIGKANLSEWANFRSSHSTSGWSTLGGQTANPYALDRNPSGSSSGSAAGVAAGPATAAVLDEVVARLRSLGAVLTDPVELPGADKVGEPEFAALHYEFKYGINAYLAYVAEFSAAETLPGTLAELIDFNKRNADLVLSRFGQEIFEQSEATSGDLADPAYLALRRDATRLARTAISAPLADHELEAIVSLTTSPACLTDYVLGDHHVFGTSSPAAVAGCPSITVPAGSVSGLPVGVSFFGPRWTESRLIALAYAFEQATRHRY